MLAEIRNEPQSEKVCLQLPNLCAEKTGKIKKLKCSKKKKLTEKAKKVDEQSFFFFIRFVLAGRRWPNQKIKLSD